MGNIYRLERVVNVVISTKTPVSPYYLTTIVLRHLFASRQLPTHVSVDRVFLISSPVACDHPSCDWYVSIDGSRSRGHHMYSLHQSLRPTKHMFASTRGMWPVLMSQLTKHNSSFLNSISFVITMSVLVTPFTRSLLAVRRVMPGNIAMSKSLILAGELSIKVLYFLLFGSAAHPSEQRAALFGSFLLQGSFELRRRSRLANSSLDAILTRDVTTNVLVNYTSVPSGRQNYRTVPRDQSNWDAMLLLKPYVYVDPMWKEKKTVSEIASSY